MALALEHLLVVGRLGRFQQEYLDEGTGGLAEVQASLDYLGVVEHHQSPLWQILREVVEQVLAYLSMTVDEQLGVVALSHGELGNALIG